MTTAPPPGVSRPVAELGHRAPGGELPLGIEASHGRVFAFPGVPFECGSHRVQAPRSAPPARGRPV